jgi:hypothetical protein
MIEDCVVKVIRGIEVGIVSMVITGSEDNLKRIKGLLKFELGHKGINVSEIAFTNHDQDMKFSQSEDKNDLVFVSGLEILMPKDQNTYAIRSYLDQGKHFNLRSIIFCESSFYAAHFNDYDAPFYQFCLQLPIVD